jgi:citrate synthase
MQQPPFSIPPSDTSGASPHAESAPQGQTRAKEDYLSSREAAAILEVKASTLYTYVSRGLIRATAQTGRKERLYLREDIEALKARSQARSGHSAVAASALQWGQPVINSRITAITPEGPRYRGHLATLLAEQAGGFENVVELLWTGMLAHERFTWPIEPISENLGALLTSLKADEHGQPKIMQAFSLTTSALDVPVTEEMRRGASVTLGHQILFVLAGCCGLLGPQRRFVAPTGRKSIAQHALEAIGAPVDEETVRAIDKALIISADHELGSATFVARIAASSGASLQACVAAALATHSGTALAAGCDRIEDLVRGCDDVQQLKRLVQEVKRSRGRLMSFDLQLYPNGDPRAQKLIELAKSRARQPRRAELIYHLVEEIEQQLGMRANIEVGLVCLAAALELPDRSAGALWTLGRSAGWIAHVFEQRLAGYVLRPRAQFELGDS